MSKGKSYIVEITLEGGKDLAAKDINGKYNKINIKINIILHCTSTTTFAFHIIFY
jgi:hypothetical protein